MAAKTAESAERIDAGAARLFAAAPVPPLWSAADNVVDVGQRAVEALRVPTTALRHVGAAAPLAAELLGDGADDLAGVVAADEIRRDHRDQRHLVPLHAGEHDDP